jgi:ABC-2 type transport system permease protein
MSRLAALAKAGLKSNFGLSLLRHRLFRQKKDLWLVPVFILAALALLPALYGFIILLKSLYLTLEPMGQQRALLTFGLLGGQLFVLIFGLYYVISAFYFSRDLEMLIPLPLRPFEVMFSKFAVILVNEYLTIFILVVPILVVYGVMAGAGPIYWAIAVIVYLALPVIPLAMASILVVALMRLVNFSRKKDALILAGSILLIALSLGVQLAAGRAGNKNLDNATVTALFSSPDSLVNRIGAKFPPSIWATKALAEGFAGAGPASLGFFLAVSMGLFGVILLVSEKLFYRGLIGLAEVSGRRRALSAAEMSRRVSSGRHPVRAVFAREWRIMNRTPIFFLNGTLVVVIIPVLFIVMAMSGSKGGDNTFLLKVMTSANPTTVILATAVFMTFCGSLNGTSSSTFSREGRHFWLSQVIPVAPRDQVAAKFLHSYLVALLGVITASVVAILMLHLKAWVLAAAAALALAAAVPLTVAGMIIDLARPLLDWTNPQKAIKQNANVLLAMIADVGILTALFFLVKFLIQAGVGGAGLCLVLFSVLAVTGAAGWRFLAGFATRRYRDIES